MIINIENFNNIPNFCYKLEDGKVNFLFGICGSGKSSLASSLLHTPNVTNAMVGKKIEDVNVRVNGKEVDYSMFSIFNQEYLNNVLINKTDGKDIYEIILSNHGEIDKCRKKYQKAIDALTPFKNDIYASIEKINELKNSLKISYNNDGSLSRKSKIAKFEKNLINLKTKFPKAKSYSAEEIKWINSGIKNPKYDKSICPFCGAGISPSKKLSIDTLANFDASDYEAINSKTSIFIDAGIKLPRWENKKSRLKFFKQIKMYCDLMTELLAIKNYISIAQSIDFSASNRKIIKLSENFKLIFPKICDAIVSFNANIKEIKETMGRLRRATNKVIISNTKKINENIAVLGIPYKFAREDIDEENKNASFKLCHVNDIEQKDMVSSLSSGEKSLIALIFFLYSKKDQSNLIIDDPVSSFDEFRRKVIFDFLFDLNSKSTILVLSHDHVFAKFAVYHKNSKVHTKYKNRIGKIDFLESFDSFKTTPISENDFVSIEDCVLKKLSSLGNIMNYRVALNIRFLFEIKSKRPRDVYSYLSAIIHRTPYLEIISLLKSSKIDESKVLDLICEFSKIRYEKLDVNYIADMDVSQLCLFEKALYGRETINKSSKEGKIIYDEISNIIHLNSAYAICLNPYFFNYFSKFVFDYVKTFTL